MTVLLNSFKRKMVIEEDGGEQGGRMLPGEGREETGQTGRRNGDDLLYRRGQGLGNCPCAKGGSP